MQSVGKVLSLLHLTILKQDIPTLIQLNKKVLIWDGKIWQILSQDEQNVNSELNLDWLSDVSVSLDGNYLVSGKVLVKVTVQSATKESLTIPEGIEEIAPYAFSWCDKLQRISFPSSLKTIGENAFGYCIKLESIQIPEPVITIGDYVLRVALVLPAP